MSNLDAEKPEDSVSYHICAFAHGRCDCEQRLCKPCESTERVANYLGKYAIVQNAKEFTLVPWQPQMERLRGREVSGTVGGQGINWDWDRSRQRGLGISGI